MAPFLSTCLFHGEPISGVDCGVMLSQGGGGKGKIDARHIGGGKVQDRQNTDG